MHVCHYMIKIVTTFVWLFVDICIMVENYYIHIAAHISKDTFSGSSHIANIILFNAVTCPLYMPRQICCAIILSFLGERKWNVHQNLVSNEEPLNSNYQHWCIRNLLGLLWCLFYLNIMITNITDALIFIHLSDRSCNSSNHIIPLTDLNPTTCIQIVAQAWVHNPKRVYVHACIMWVSFMNLLLRIRTMMQYIVELPIFDIGIHKVLG